MKEKKTPERMCVACRQMKPKNALIRVVRSPEGEISLDPTGKKSGRGAYLCKNPECLKKCRKTRALGRALGVAISDEVFDVLAGEMDDIDRG